MKLIFLAALIQGLAVPLASAAAIDLNGAAADVVDKRADCNIKAHWETNWRDAGYHRYRVIATATGNGPEGMETPFDMLAKWCKIFIRHTSGNWNLYNPQCWVDGTTAYADVSTYIGQNGHNEYKKVHQTTVNEWRFDSKHTCGVDSNF